MVAKRKVKKQWPGWAWKTNSGSLLEIVQGARPPQWNRGLISKGKWVEVLVIEKEKVIIG